MAIFINTQGDQTYRGTETEYDQVDYAGDLSDYTMTQNADGSVTVTHPTFGTDRLESIEGFWFQGESRWYSMDDALAAQTTTPPVESDLAATDVDVIAFAGQSNSANMFFRLDRDTSNPLGSEVFEGQMNALTGFTTEAVNAAYGSSASNETADPDMFWWNLAEDRPGQVLLDAVRDIQRGLDRGQDLDAIIWSQGESDAYSIFFGGDPDVQIARMIEATTQVFEYFRAEFGADVPIFIQEMGEFEVPIQLAPGEANAFDLVRDAQLALAESDPNIFMSADTSDLPIYTDGLHYTTETYGEIATMHANSIVSVLAGENPDGPTPPTNGEINGTTGDDQLLGTNGDDIINGLGGSDLVVGSAGNDTITMGEGYDQVNYAGASEDYAFIRNADGTVSVTKPDGSEDTLDGVDGFWFQGEAAWYAIDSLIQETTPPENNGPINGTNGDDQLIGTAGDDVIFGLGGSDGVIGSGGSDVISLGDEYDQVDYAGASTDYTFVSNEDGSISVTKPDGSVDTLIGVDGIWFQGEAAWYRVDALVVTPPSDGPINGTNGDDQLSGTTGDDVIFGLEGSDVVIGSAGNDTISLGDEYDQVNYTGAAADYIFEANGDGSFSMTKEDGSVDTLIGVDGFWFQGEAAWYSADDLLTLV